MTRAAVAARPPLVEHPVFVAPGSWRVLPRSAADSTPRYRILGKWARLIGTHVHLLVVERTQNAVFAKGGETADYAPFIVNDIRGESRRFELIGRRRETICDGRDAFFVQFTDRSAQMVNGSVLFTVVGDAAYTAIYEHDPQTQDLPEATRALRSLCPPAPQT